MEQSKSDTCFESLRGLTQSELLEGVWLLVLKPEQAPPHLAMLCDGKYFSISVRGLDNGKPAHQLLQALDRNRTPILALNISRAGVEWKEVLATKFTGISLDNHTTCLSPIATALSEAFAFNPSAVYTIHDLVPILRSLNAIEKAGTCNLPQQRVCIPFYDRAAVGQVIRELNKQEA